MMNELANYISAEDLFPEALDLVRTVFHSGFSNQPGEATLEKAFRHHFAAPGKLTRLRVSLEASYQLGLDSDSAKACSACVETLHTASLILDDFQDGSLTRRGRPSVYAYYGRDISIGLTLQLVSTATGCLSRIGNSSLLPKAIGEMHQVVSETITGQLLDMSPETSSEKSELKPASALKSGPLFGLALSLPLILSDRMDCLKTCRDIGYEFGLGYQILDDVKDRAHDRIQDADNNLVNALESVGKPNDLALGEAIRLAESHLQNALELSDSLPAHCGVGMIAIIREVKDLKDTHIFKSPQRTNLNCC
jgi:geranylgeranyl pyrophosphate synthase